MTAKKRTILLADDEPQFLRLVSYLLRLEGYAVVAVHDGEQAMEQMQILQPDLVLLDVLMPKVDGLTACQRIRTFSTVPIIILTAWGVEQERVRGLRVGASAYLNKPFDLDTLLDICGRYTGCVGFPLLHSPFASRPKTSLNDRRA